MKYFNRLNETYDVTSSCILNIMFYERTCEHKVQIADAERARTRIWKQPHSLEQTIMGTRRATIKRNAPVMMMGQGATLTEKKIN
jgi:hypothetical protein